MQENQSSSGSTLSAEDLVSGGRLAGDANDLASDKTSWMSNF